MKLETSSFSTFYKAEGKKELITFNSKNGKGISCEELKKYFPQVPIVDISTSGLRHFPDAEFHEIGFFRLYDSNLKELVRGKAERFFKLFSLLLKDLQLTNSFLEGKMTKGELVDSFNLDNKTLEKD